MTVEISHNGITVTEEHDGGVSVFNTGTRIGHDLPAKEVNAVREYFKVAENICIPDPWVDPVTGHIVVRTPDVDDIDGRAVSIPTLLDDGEWHPNYHFWENYMMLEDRSESKEHPYNIVFRYFEAHPKPESLGKPWVNAREGEVWKFKVRTGDGSETNTLVATVDRDGMFYYYPESIFLRVNHQDIVGAEKLDV